VSPTTSPPPRSWRLRPIVTAVIATVVIHVAAMLALAVSVVTLFQARRFVMDVIITRLSRVILRAGGVHVEVVGADDGRPPWWSPPGTTAPQRVYVFNHTSSLDLFVVCALGLPRVRFFMKRKFLLFVPFGLLGLLSGTFFTMPQTMPEARTRLFQRATRVLRATGESVFLSPEGTRVTTGEIGPFNKGAFHLAAALQAPIVPLYFETSSGADPGRGLLVGEGVVRVHVLPGIDTRDWDVADIGRHRDDVHALYVATRARLRGGP
jgi:putative phosphoserine phosphatase/1-acylglycerol-3-phosphate O-acyltransferase